MLITQQWECLLQRGILERRLPPTDKRFASFLYALDLMTQRGTRTIIETGTARGGESNCIGDGGSTLIWAEWAGHFGAVVHSVDIDPKAVSESKLACAMNKDHVHIVCGDSVVFLREFKKPIDLLYLDSYDFDVDDPLPSQQYHLDEIKAAYPMLHSNSVVMIDDCDLPHGGKGKLVIDYLLEKSWKKVFSSYQVILV